jgi:glycine/D-amino acid oxidase-like deaminating enzyme
MLKLSALALTGTAIPTGRALGASPPGVSPQQNRNNLPKVLVVPERIIRTVVGLRPFRSSGFVVRADSLGRKTIIHNYGHGGCGVTLSWGTARIATEHALKTGHRQAAVLGCGAVGLATARLLQDRGFDVTIYAKDLPPDTTSNIAGALWAPVTLADSPKSTPAFVRQLDQASRFAHRYFQNLVGERYGVRWVETFFIGDRSPSLPWEYGVTPDLSPITTLPQGSHPFPAPFASRIYTMLIEPSVYLPAVLSDFRWRGGRIVVREFPNLASILRLRERVVVNCTGLGAKNLFNDNELVPIKGQLTVLVPQPEVDYAFVSTPNDLYMFSRRDGIILGGSHEEGVWSLEPSKIEAERIFKGHQELFATLH